MRSYMSNGAALKHLHGLADWANLASRGVSVTPCETDGAILIGDDLRMRYIYPDFVGEYRAIQGWKLFLRGRDAKKVIAEVLAERTRRVVMGALRHRQEQGAQDEE